MKDVIQNQGRQDEIDIIHSSLYQFTKKKLNSLESYDSYRFLIYDFKKRMKNKSSIQDDIKIGL
jgi:hypothetical protein